MRNYIAEGNAITVVTPPAPANFQSGKGYVVGSLFGVAIKTTTEGQTNELYTEGVYAFPGEGNLYAAAYYDVAAGTVTDTSAPYTYKIGVIVGSGDGTVEVRLNGTDVVAEA
ncbi:DUF2190 family protein [Sinorhizobium medicae]|nr:DUF2190 family protein [Sinorhizobium medicae]